MGNKQVKMEALLTTRQAAKLLNYSQDYLMRLCKAGKIPAHRVAIGKKPEWRIRPEDIRRLVQGKGGER